MMPILVGGVRHQRAVHGRAISLLAPGIAAATPLRVRSFSCRRWRLSTNRRTPLPRSWRRNLARVGRPIGAAAGRVLVVALA